jgi:hypothetical protein
MEVSPSASTLYRTGWRAVTFVALAVILTGVVTAQTGNRASTKKSRGPRAIGLLELAPNGKAHLIPITILIDGEYYDASAYKADPVPMALEAGTVYEAISTGVSQGLFTVAGAVQANQAWIGEGSWQVAGSAPAKKAEAPKHPADDDVGGPPVLRRSGPTPAKPPEAPSAESKRSPAEPEKKAEETPAAPPAESAPAEDPDRPTLHRGKPVESEKKPSVPGPVATKPTAPASLKPIAPAGVKVIPAISDANVQEPRSFEFKMKPEEEEQFRKQMLAMAGDEVNARVKTLETSTMETAPHPGKGRAAKAPAPSFENVQMRVFDLTSSNEPILVLTATAHPKLAKGQSDIPYFVTLIARNNIYAELKKVQATITDPQHLDVVPQLELIDAVDADGDGHGELLFRRSSDNASAYAIYRVIGTQLYPLFEGKIS